jgi:Haem-degrading
MATARGLIDSAVAKAGSLGINSSIAILDGGGHLVAFQRMDGAAPFTVDVAQGKAYGVIFMRRTSAELRDMASARPQFLDAVKSLGRRTLIPLARRSATARRRGYRRQWCRRPQPGCRRRGIRYRRSRLVLRNEEFRCPVGRAPARPGHGSRAPRSAPDHRPATGTFRRRRGALRGRARD